MLHTHRWLIAIGGLAIFLALDISYFLYPLHLIVIEKQQLSKQYQKKNTLPSNKTAAATEKKPLTPYHHTVWLSEFTKQMSELSVSINKIEKATTNDMLNTSHWNVSLSGNAYTLFRAFHLLYRHFPWLAIAEPHFVLNNQEISTSFQLIALLQKPADHRSAMPVIPVKQMFFPFCQSRQQYTIENINSQEDRIAGAIQYGQTKATLIRVDNEHISIAIQSPKN